MPNQNIANNAEVERANERAAAEGHGRLHPTGTSQFTVAREPTEEASALDGLDLFNVILHLELRLVFEGFLVANGAVDAVMLKGDVTSLAINIDT